jgi:hypothetical protein
MTAFGTTETKNALPPEARGFPRILTLAAERAGELLLPPEGQRLIRSERREALQSLIVAMLRFLDLPSMRLGAPTLNGGFVGISLDTLIATSRISRRRCMRALADLRGFGFVVVVPPINSGVAHHSEKHRARLPYGKRRGLAMTTKFFEQLRLGNMLQKERHKAAERLRQRAERLKRSLLKTEYRKKEEHHAS